MQPHFHVTATADDGTRAEHIEGEGAYLPALAVARRLVQEARLPGGTVTYNPMTGDAPFCGAGDGQTGGQALLYRGVGA